LCLWFGDVTKIAGEDLAIVNAANITLRKGGGVNGIIHRAAGKQLEQECRLLALARENPIGVTECIITDGYNLPCAKVIHSISPSQNQKDELYTTYMNVFELALENDLGAVCIPALSTGSHFFSHKDAAEVAITAGRDFLANLGSNATDTTATSNSTPFLKIIYCCVDESMLEIYKSSFAEVIAAESI